MARAIWNGATLAESDETVVVDGNHYFPRESLDMRYFRESETETVCGWKGTASYWTLGVGGDENPDAAWTYREPKEAAENLRDRVAFWRGVVVEGTGG